MKYITKKDAYLLHRLRIYRDQWVYAGALNVSSNSLTRLYSMGLFEK